MVGIRPTCSSTSAPATVTLPLVMMVVTAVMLMLFFFFSLMRIISPSQDGALVASRQAKLSRQQEWQAKLLFGFTRPDRRRGRRRLTNKPCRYL